MEAYIPPFTITNRMLLLVSSISEKAGRLGCRGGLDSRPHLRRSNRIRSIHASLAIEANSLSLSEVHDVIDGHPVSGEPKDILEVKNAYAAYEKIGSVDPYSIEDLKMLHRITTSGIIPDAGKFRTHPEGVFSGGKCIFLAPPPDRVPGLMERLFVWMRENREAIHPLILSAVFHYEFVFIHPFSDGNGRMARLWHTVLLSNKWRVFESIPLESKIEMFQQDYYRAIAACHQRGNSDIFIEFMLEKIDLILDDILVQASEPDAETGLYEQKLLDIMDPGIPYTAAELMRMLGLRSPETFRKNYMHPALAHGRVVMTVPDKPNSRNQRYILKKNNG